MLEAAATALHIIVVYHLTYIFLQSTKMHYSLFSMNIMKVLLFISLINVVESLATVDVSEVYSALAKMTTQPSINKGANNGRRDTSKNNNGDLKSDGISVTNKTDTGNNSTSLVLTIGENFITKW